MTNEEVLAKVRELHDLRRQEQDLEQAECRAHNDYVNAGNDLRTLRKQIDCLKADISDAL